MFLKEYQKLRELGKGAFAKVYKVRHKELGYIRAIRVLNEIISDENDECYEKFLAECKILLRLGNGGHPNIVHIYQPRLLQNHALVEMDYVDGYDIDDYLKSQNQFIAIDEVMQFMENIGSALAYCHEDIYQFCMDRQIDNLQDDPEDGRKVLVDEATHHQLVEKYKITHNDIHSKNIMRKNLDGSFVLLDFGLAIQDGTVVKSSTRRGGAPEYKAPEKWENEGVISERTDIYSFGILLYEMLAGRVPFPYDSKITQQRSEYEISEQHLNATPLGIEPLRRATYEAAFPEKTYTKDYPDWLERVIVKCLEKKPEDRYANGKELYEEIKPLVTTFNQSNVEIKEVIKTEVVEKQVEVIREKIVHKNNPLWVVLTIVFALISLGAGYYYYLNEPASANSEVYQTQIDDLQKQLDEKNTEITELQSKSGNSNQNIITERNRLKKENENLKQENSQLKSTSNSSNSGANIQTLEAEISRLQKDKTLLNTTINQKDNEIKGLRNAVDEQIKQNRLLTTTIEELKTKK